MKWNPESVQFGGNEDLYCPDYSLPHLNSLLLQHSCKYALVVLDEVELITIQIVLSSQIILENIKRIKIMRNFNMNNVSTSTST